MGSIYQYWDTQQAYSGWEKPRSWQKRFSSEKHFLEKFFKPDMSVLDIGCATGDLHLGLTERFGYNKYVGIDTSPVMITGAKQLCHDCEFHVGDILKEDMVVGREFDLVTATGVFQHEPEFRKLLNKMLEHTKDGGYVLFDYKLFHSHSSILDINQAYCDLPSRLYFNVLNFKDALNWLSSLENVSEISMFGYYSGTHHSVRLPASVQEEVCSAHVLLKKGKPHSQQPLINLELPEGFNL